jgi:glycosyltransferase 2 family protein
VLQGDARPLDSLDAGETDNAVLAGSWRALDLLHRARIAHRRIDTHTVALLNGEVGLVDFAGATARPTAAQLLTDRAQLLVTTAAVAGSDRAVTAGVESLGAAGVAELVPYLQPAALRGSLRQATKAAGIDLDELRNEAATRVGTEEPGLVRLRRVTWGSLVQAALLLLAALAVLSFATGIDYDQLWGTLQDASWGWILLGFGVAQLPRLTQATATLGSVAADLRFGPVYVLQLATSYMNLALPSSAARLAVNIRFFQRQGITPAAAVTAGAIDSFASTVVQAVLLALLLLFTEANLNLEFSAPSGGSLAIVAVLAGLVIAAVAAAVLVGRLRRLIVGWVRRFWPEVRAALSALRSSNKIALLLGGSLATELLFAFALGLFALGLGTRISFADLLVLNIGVTLITTIIPIPGGIGVSELGLTVGLAAAGMTDEAALAAVLLYRVSTFYLPPTWGFFALRHLQRNRYL